MFRLPQKITYLTKKLEKVTKDAKYQDESEYLPGILSSI